jgi:hypothetical protein
MDLTAKLPMKKEENTEIKSHAKAQRKIIIA